MGAAGAGVVRGPRGRSLPSPAGRSGRVRGTRGEANRRGSCRRAGQGRGAPGLERVAVLPGGWCGRRWSVPAPGVCVTATKGDLRVCPRSAAGAVGVCVPGGAVRGKAGR